MKYLINKETKEHVIYVPWLMNSQWTLVEADSEGWIPHTGTVCPLPDDCMVDTMWDDGQGAPRMAAGHWKWRDPSITHYRPILAEKVQEPDFIGADLDLPADCFEQGLDRKIEADKKRALQMRASEDAAKLDLIGRLCVAHKHAQTIPDLEAELREVLGSMGYDLVARSPFVDLANNQQDIDPEFAQAIEDNIFELGKSEPAEDMSDWRNWRERDLVECVDGYNWDVFKQGGLYRVTKTHKEWVYIDTWPIYQHIKDFRFHSRPAKGEK